MKKRIVFGCVVAAAFLGVASLAAEGDAAACGLVCESDWAHPRVVFDRPGGFTVWQGEEATLTATLAGGSGGIWFLEDRWESNNGGHVTGPDNETFVIDTSVPGLYWVKATGASDGTDGEYTGKIRFRVAPAKGPAGMGAKAIQIGETLIWSEDFEELTGGESKVQTEFHGWTGDKWYNKDRSVKIGTGDFPGHVMSPVSTLDGSTGRLEFSMRYYSTSTKAAQVALERSEDSGANWLPLATYSALTNPAITYSVDVPASGTVKFKWSNSLKNHTFVIDDVKLYVPKMVDEHLPPTIDFNPEGTEATLIAGKPFSLEVTATDYDGDEVTLSASGVPETATWTADEPGTNSVAGVFEWTPETLGTFTVAFSATDTDGTRTAEVTLTVVPEGPGMLAFESEGARPRESSREVSLTVLRTGGAAGAVSVSWTTVDGTATNGVEYVAASGTLGFAPGQEEATLTVSLLDNLDPEDVDKTFIVTLSSPLGGATLGAVDTCTVTIVDDDRNANYYTRCYNDGGTLRTGTDLRETLCQILNENVITNEFGSNLDPILTKLDECPTNRSLRQCIYLQSGIGSFQKEHIWPQSQGCRNPPAAGDLHHLRACDSYMNLRRSNKNFDDRRNVAGATELNGCWYTLNPDAWEPPDSAKGDVARAVFYMDVRYENKYGEKVDLVVTNGLNPGANQLGNRATLLEWNELDPPDDFERRRNELIYSTYQFNRNPFIDHPTWVRAVFDPTNFTNETIEWTVNVTWQGPGRVNSQAAPHGQAVPSGQTQEFFVEPDPGRHCHIASIAWDGELQTFATNAAGAATFVSPPVTDNATLAVEFEAERAAKGTPLWWLEQYGAGQASVQDGDWDEAELEDWNGDGILNWEEYANGTDPAAAVLRPVTGLRAASTDSTGFTLAWEPRDGYSGYRVVVCSTAAVEAASAGFESGEVDPGWVASPAGAEVRTTAAASGTQGLTFSARGAWLVSPPVENPFALEFQYKRSSNTNQWTLAIDVSTDGGATWVLDVDSVSDAKANAKLHSTDLSAWRDQTVLVRLRDAREGSGVAQRHLDDVAVKTSGPAVLRGMAAGNSWTAAGLAPGMEYAVAVRGETASGEAGPWCAAVAVSTDADESGRRSQTINFPAIADQLAPYPLTLEATASSGLQVAYELEDGGPGVLVGNILSFTGAGTVTVTASQGGNETFAPAQSVAVSFEVSKATQEITLEPDPIGDQFVEATVELSASANSGLPVVCSVAGAVLAGNTLSCTVPGTVTVTASQAGNDLWEAAETTMSFNVAETGDAKFYKISQLADLEPGEYVITGTGTRGECAMLNQSTGGSAPAIQRVTNTVALTGGAILNPDSSIVWNLATNGTDGGWTIFNADKECYVEYHGNANSAFFTNEITSKSSWTIGISGGLFEVRNVAVTNRIFRYNGTSGSERFSCYTSTGIRLGFYKKKLNSAQTVQTISFAPIGDQTPGATVTLQATADSGLGVTFELSGDSIVQRSGNTLTFTGTGSVTVTAVQEGNATYRPASASQTFRVQNGQTISFDPIGEQITTNTVTLAATASSGLPVTFTIAGGAEIAQLEGATLTFTGPGWVTVTAIQEGNAAYRPASASQTFRVSEPQTPEDPYETWLAGLGLQIADYPSDGRGENGCENWKNFVWDIAPTNTEALEVTHMAAGPNGALVLTVPLASTNRHYRWVHWPGFERGANPVDDADVLDLGPGSPSMSIPNGLAIGGFGLLEATFE